MTNLSMTSPLPFAAFTLPNSDAMSNNSATLTPLTNSTELPRLDTSSLPPAMPCVYRFSPHDIVRSSVFLFGFGVNAILLYTIYSTKRRRTPTYLVVSFISLSDLIYHLFGLLFSFTIAGFTDKSSMKISPMCPEFFRSKTLITVLDIVLNGHYTTSAFLIPYLYMIRYLILVHHFWTVRKLTTLRVTLGSVALWILIMAYYVSSQFLYDKTSAGVMEIINWVITYPLVILVTLVIHVVKVKAIRKISMIEREADIKRMNTFVAMVILAYALLCLPWNILKCLFYFGTIRITYEMWFYCGLFLIANNCMNPILYGFVSLFCTKPAQRCHGSRKRKRKSRSKNFYQINDNKSATVSTILP